MPDPLLPPPPVALTWRSRFEQLIDGRPRWQVVSGAVIAVVVAVAIGLFAWAAAARASSPPVEQTLPVATHTTEPPTSPSSTGAATLTVHVAGAVAAPGVYRLTAGARVLDAVRAAGGARPDADPQRLNLAAPVADGQRVFVPRVGEALPATVGGGAGSTSGTSPPGPVDLNSATVEQLDALPGVGPSTAAAIVSYRERNGPFSSVDQLLDVRGIGPSKLDAIRDLVTV